MDREVKGKGKCKPNPRTGHEGPWDEWRYSYTLSFTLGLDALGGQRHAPALPQERSDIHC